MYRYYVKYRYLIKEIDGEGNIMCHSSNLEGVQDLIIELAPADVEREDIIMDYIYREELE